MRLSIWNPPPVRAWAVKVLQESRLLYRGHADARSLVQGMGLLGALIVFDRMLGFPAAFRMLYIAPVWFASLRGSRLPGVLMVLLTSMAVSAIDYSVGIIPPGGSSLLLNIFLRLAVLFALMKLMDEMERRLRYLSRLATHDALTGVANRIALEEYAARATERANAAKSKLSVAMIDCDRFKQLNDAFGHEFGDVVLRGVARALRRAVQNEGIVARTGGDEFVVVMPGRDREDLAKAMEAALHRFMSSSEVAGRASGFSFGVASYGVDRKSFSEMLRAADDDMYRRKAERAAVEFEDLELPSAPVLLYPRSA